MKVGDKVYCKKELRSKPHGWRVIVNVGDICHIIGLNVDYVEVSNDKYKYQFGINPNYYHDINFENYFYTKKEMRRMKLDKLNIE